MENFIRKYKVDKKLCEDLIKYYKLNCEYKLQGMTIPFGVNKEIKESTDVIFYNQSNDKTILKFFNILSNNIINYINEFELDIKLITSTINLIQHYPKGGGYKIFHYENGNILTIKRKLVYMLYLNDVVDGGTEFKYQKIILNAEKGNLIIWPADFTHTHKGIISNTKEKYIATGWFEIDS